MPAVARSGAANGKLAKHPKRRIALKKSPLGPYGLISRSPERRCHRYSRHGGSRYRQQLGELAEVSRQSRRGASHRSHTQGAKCAFGIFEASPPLKCANSGSSWGADGQKSDSASSRVRTTTPRTAHLGLFDSTGWRKIRKTAGLSSTRKYLKGRDMGTSINPLI